MPTVRFQFKVIAEKLKEFLPQSTYTTNQTVEVERNGEPFSTGVQGGEEAMAVLDSIENLV